RQRRALEDAIAEVERSYAPVKAEPLDELESVLNSLNGLTNEPVAPPQPRPSEPHPVEQPRTFDAPHPVTAPTSRPPAPEQPVRQPESPVETAPEDEFEPLDDDEYESQPQQPIAAGPERRRGFGR